MVLKLASDEVQEVRRALSSAYSDVLRELGRATGFRSPEPALDLCHRKSKLEALLHQLDHVDDAPRVLELIPANGRDTLQKEAA